MVIGNKYYQEGVKDWKAGKKRKDCPYKFGTKKWQYWFNGWDDEGEKAFAKLLKTHPDLGRLLRESPHEE